MPLYPQTERKGFDGQDDGTQFIAEATMQDLLLPGSDSDSVYANLRNTAGVESESEMKIYDPYNQNCIFPGEIIQVVFDSQSGQLMPNGSNGLIRRVRAKADAAINTLGQCDLLSEDDQKAETVVGEIDVYANPNAYKKDEVFWVTYRLDLAPKAAATPENAAAGRWVPVTPADGKPTNGMVRGTAESDFVGTDNTVDLQVTFSNVAGVNVNDIITANNYIEISGDIAGPCYAWCHGDVDPSTPGDTNTFDLIAAKCPA